MSMSLFLGAALLIARSRGEHSRGSDSSRGVLPYFGFFGRGSYYFCPNPHLTPPRIFG